MEIVNISRNLRRVIASPLSALQSNPEPGHYRDISGKDRKYVLYKLEKGMVCGDQGRLGKDWNGDWVLENPLNLVSEH